MEELLGLSAGSEEALCSDVAIDDSYAYSKGGAHIGTSGAAPIRMNSYEASDFFFNFHSVGQSRSNEVNHIVVFPGLAVPGDIPALLLLAQELTKFSGTSVHVADFASYDRALDAPFKSDLLVNDIVQIITDSHNAGDSISFIGHSAGNDVAHVVIERLMDRGMTIKMWTNLVGRPRFDDGFLYTTKAYIAALETLADRTLNATKYSVEEVQTAKVRVNAVLDSALSLGEFSHDIPTIYLLARDDDVFPLELYDIPFSSQKILFEGGHDILFSATNVVVEECCRVLARQHPEIYYK
jgi:hypothetical protein